MNNSKWWLKQSGSFQDEAANDLEAVFFNVDAKEFVTTHKIKGITGINSVEHDCEVIIDNERYFDRAIKDKIEGINLQGLVFFIKKADWLEKFGHVPVGGGASALRFDGKPYLVIAVADDMGSLEFTIESNWG